jgi:molybdenum cofactor guanylyltransferase
MGRDKATLPFGAEAMLQRVVRLMAEAVPAENIVVVAGVGQSLPALPSQIVVARDSVEFRGPLAGIATGLRELSPNRLDAAFVAGCDAPYLMPAFVARMFDLLGDHDAAVPVDLEHHYSLAAVYRLTVLPHIEALVAEGHLRAGGLFDKIDTCRVPVEAFLDVDPQLRSLQNLNSEEEYRAALDAAGFAT